jgi:hypothetical protein
MKVNPLERARRNVAIDRARGCDFPVTDPRPVIVDTGWRIFPFDDDYGLMH